MLPAIAATVGEMEGDVVGLTAGAVGEVVGLAVGAVGEDVGAAVGDEVVGLAVGGAVATQHTVQPSPVYEGSLCHDICIDPFTATATLFGPIGPE